MNEPEPPATAPTDEATRATEAMAATEATPACRATYEIGLDRIRHVEPKLDAGGSPYRPDTAVDGGSANGLIVRAASVRGRSKRFQGQAREDDFCLQPSAARPALVIAIADGMGSATRGGLGAALAVRHAVEAIEEQLAECAPESLQWPKIFNRAASALVVEHRRAAGEEHRDRPGQDEAQAVSRDLGTTLTVAVVERSAGGGMQASVAAIGDSPAFRLVGGAYELLVGEREQDEVFSTSAVVALPYLPAPEARTVCLERDEVLLIGTDGFSGPLGSGGGDVGQLFARELVTPPPLSSWSYLVDFAKATYDDDRTLVAVWPREEQAQDPANGA